MQTASLLASSWAHVATSTDLEDRTDGTIEFTITRTLPQQGKVVSVRTGLIKKCLQGQQYRPADNDCRGTGSASTKFGALALQFCAAQDCVDDSGFLTGKGSSEAFQSCNGDSTAGLQWVVAPLLPLPFSHADVRALFPEATVVGHYWSNRVRSDSRLSEARAYYHVPASPSRYADDQTARKHVLCMYLRDES